MSLVVTQISNHPAFPSVERFVEVTMQSANSEAKRFEFWYKVRYMLKEDDISNIIRQPINRSIFIFYTKKILLRNPKTFEPIENPDYDAKTFEGEVNEYDVYLWNYGWDIISHLINQPTNIVELIENYILLNDLENYFD